ncbi:hypothetical protein AJ78_07774 [Emergomyces pasteurianus Ep9510]|uniref:Uncharacterized protein n=1 Tax=Emergomyces pasteurianus Ep9510 TaxID=1447872 RepID=A0A1J9Q6B1_9EURO|nr:hypothetical protein AJ78_07774 [Emergomyces pasteurianus Ep9510]
MDTLEEERPMCSEFKVLRDMCSPSFLNIFFTDMYSDKISQRQKIDVPSPSLPRHRQLRLIASVLATLQNEYSTTMSEPTSSPVRGRGSLPAGIDQLPSLQQIGSTAPVFYQQRDGPHKNSNFGPPTSPSTGRDQLGTYHNTVYPSKRRKPEDPQSPFRENRDKKMPFKIFMCRN